MVVAVPSITLIFIESDYVTVLHILRDSSFSPTLKEELLEFTHGWSLCTFDYFGWYAVEYSSFAIVGGTSSSSITGSSLMESRVSLEIKFSLS